MYIRPMNWKVWNKFLVQIVYFYFWKFMILSFRKGEVVMSKIIVVFQSPDDILEFVQKVEKYPYNMDMKRGKYVVDAKSLLGLMNLGFHREIELEVHEEECEDLRKDIEEFIAA
jgi:phosphocarrier protein HPr